MADGATESGAARVLVVEDEEAILDFVEMGLRYEGFEVERAGDGPSALAAFARRRPDLVILDLNLPGLDGLDVCRQIRLRSDVPIIMLTARGEVDERVEGLEAGADDYLAKPFDLDELLARLRALRRRHLDTARSLPLGTGRLDLDTRQVHRDDMDGADPVRLSERESALLATPAGRARSIPAVSCSRWCSQMPRVRWW